MIKVEHSIVINRPGDCFRAKQEVRAKGCLGPNPI